MSRYNLDELAEHIRPYLPALMQRFAPNAKPAGGAWRLGNLRGEPGGSLWIGNTGFHDHATDEKGSHITFFSQLLGLSIAETARQLAQATNFTKKATDENQAKQEIRVEWTFGPLSDLHRKYLEGRGFEMGLLDRLPIKTASNGDIALLHNSYEGKLLFAKLYNQPSKKWYSNKEALPIPWLIDFVAKEKPDADTLYITEGQWDAIAVTQAGFAGISVPNGANNHHWIENCAGFLSTFQHIVLCFDNDKPGQEALQVLSTRLPRHFRILAMPPDCKDANDILLRHGIEKLREVLANPVDYNPPEIVRASDLIEQAGEHERPAFQYDTPWGNSFAFSFRPSEYSVFTSYTGHGKSNTIRQMMAYLAYKHNARIFIASFEDPKVKVVTHLMRNLHFLHPDQIREALSRIDLLDSTHPKFNRKKIDKETLLTIYRKEYEHKGTEVFVTDNLMTLKISREDNQAQADAAEEFRQFAIGLPAHHLLVAHPRKPPTNAISGKLIPPDPSEIRGAAEIADASWNIISSIRNIPKERDIQIARNRGDNAERLAKLDRERPDAIVQINKQRETGLLPTLWLWRDAFGNFHDSPDRTTRW